MVDKHAAVIAELNSQIGAVADADHSRGRVATEHVSRERHRSHEGFERPRRSGDNQPLNSAAEHKLKVIGHGTMVPVHV